MGPQQSVSSNFPQQHLEMFIRFAGAHGVTNTQTQTTLLRL